MKERYRPGKSGLLMLELLLCVGIFAFCAAVCLGLFARADAISRESAELDRAVSEARNVAELFRAAGGSLEETASLAGGWTEGACVVVSYDENWTALPRQEDGQAVYRLELVRSETDAGYAEAALTLWGQEEEPILRWTVAALEAAS